MASPLPSANPTRAASHGEPEAIAASASAPLSTALIGTLLLDRFRVLEPLGEGGMAMVFLAEHVTLHKKCAIKVLLPEHAHKAELVERFLQEARAASMIGHENVVEISDFGQTPTGSPFFVMERLEGEDLADTLAREGRLPWPRVEAILLQICRGLAAAHGRGIVHRDLKPENVFLIRRHGSEEFVKLLDFGIAKLLTQIDGRSLTKTGVIVGTPEYMSPEQADSLAIDHRADIYSLGVLMYEMLTGRVPFEAESYAELLAMHLFEAPPRPGAVAPEAEIPAEVEAIVLKALQKDRELRFQSVGELARAIEAVGTGAPPVEVVAETRARPRTRGAALDYADEPAPATGFEDTQLASVEAEPEPPARKRRALTGGAVAVVLGGLVAGLVVAFAGDSEPEPKPAPAPSEAAAPPVIEASVEAEPEPPAEVQILLTTNVDAEIVDGQSGELLGRTNQPEGITVPRSDEPRELLLRAEGHEELALELTPSEDIAGRHELAPARPAKKRRSKRRQAKKKAKKTDPFSLLPVDG